MELLKAREAAMSRFRPMLREHGLTEQQWRVIRALADYKEIDAGELAKKSFLLAPSLDAYPAIPGKGKDRGAFCGFGRPEAIKTGIDSKRATDLWRSCTGFRAAVRGN